MTAQKYLRPVPITPESRTPSGEWFHPDIDWAARPQGEELWDYLKGLGYDTTVCPLEEADGAIAERYYGGDVAALKELKLASCLGVTVAAIVAHECNPVILLVDVEGPSQRASEGVAP